MVSSLSMKDFPKTTSLDSPEQNSLKKRGSTKDNISTIAILLATPLLALFIINFVFRTYEVDGPSMETTLHNQDRLLILKVPKTWSKVTGNPYLPKRYDIIVFNHSGDIGGSSGGERQLIKRVIGLPGERVVVRDNLARIYNKESPSGFLVDQLGPEANTISVTAGNIDLTIGDKEVFVMGDNRENSLDSRGLGTVRVEDIVGKLSLRIYPFNDYKKF